MVTSRAMAAFDAVFVGAGINSLACAALLSKAGWSVCLLERNDYLGGCIRTSTDLTAPGFTHEVLASWRFCTRMLEGWAAVDARRGTALPTYEAGSWGPKTASDLLGRDGRAWRKP